MAAPLASQVLFEAGGDVLSKYGTLCWRKGLQTRGGEIPYTFTRTGNGLYLANDVALGGLKVLTAGSGLARVEQLIDPVSGVLQNYLKLENGAANWSLQSQKLNTTPWTLTAVTVTENAAAAPDGTTTANYIVPSVANSLHYDQQNITITANENLAWSGFVKSDGTYTGFVAVVADAGVTNGFRVGVDLATGTLNIATRNFGTGTYAGSFIIALGGGWYYLGLWGAIGSGVTTAVTFLEVFDTGAHANTQTAFVGDTVHGVYAWGAQLERNGTTAAMPPTSYVATVAGTANRSTEAFSVPWFIKYADMAKGTPFWIYSRHLERGTALGDAGGFGRVWAFGDYPTGSIEVDGAATSKNYGVSHTEPGPTGVSSSPGGTPNFNDVIELLAFVYSDGSVQIRRSFNAAADAVGSRSSANAFVGTPSPKFALNSDAGGGSVGVALFSRVLVGLGAVSQISDVRGIL